MPIEKKEKAVYDNKLHAAYQRTQEPEGMTNKNVRDLQKLLQYYYPEVGKGKQFGMYDRETIQAINSFYEKEYWTTDRRIDKAKEMYGEDYIMKSEMQQMQEYFAKQDSAKKEYYSKAKRPSAKKEYYSKLAKSKKDSSSKKGPSY